MPSKHPPNNPLDSYEEALKLLYAPWGSNKIASVHEGMFASWIEVTYESGHYGCSSRTRQHYITPTVLQRLKNDGIYKSWLRIEHELKRDKLFEVMEKLGLTDKPKPEATDGLS